MDLAVMTANCLFRCCPPSCQCTPTEGTRQDRGDNTAWQQPDNVEDIKRYITRDENLGGEQDQTLEPFVVNGEDRYKIEALVAERTQTARSVSIGKF